jgi:hypothetical protein
MISSNCLISGACLLFVEVTVWVPLAVVANRLDMREAATYR